MDIFLVRHGEAATAWGKSRDPGLSEAGVLQAQAVARVLQGRIGEADVQLLSSPRARAQATAAPLAAALERPVQLDDAFREIPSPVPLAQRQVWLKQFMQQHWREQPQSLLDWRERASSQLRQLRQSAVVFTHFLVINAVVGQILGEQKTLCFWPDNGSITQLRLRDTALELVARGKEMKTRVN